LKFTGSVSPGSSNAFLAIAAAVATAVVGVGIPIAARCDEAAKPVGHQTIDVSAEHVDYFSDEDVVVARGRVQVKLPDGLAATGDAFAMDLRLQRLLVAGHVHFSTPSGGYDGAAVADFLAYHRIYFIPLVPEADRWTFRNGDYANPVKGLDMPGDTFYFPDVRGKKAYISGRRAVIDASTDVRFEPATVAILMGPKTPPLPAFVDNFSANPAFGQNSLAGATFDAPYQFFGSGHALDALHFRYNQAFTDPYYLSFEHHSIADSGAYAVFSINPMTQALKQWTLLGYLPEGTRNGLSLDAQLFTDQSGLGEPVTSNGFVDLQFVHALHQSSLLADATQAYDSLLPGVAQPDHPFILGLQWNSFQEPIFRSGFTYRLTSGVAMAHDAYGVTGTDSADVTLTDGAATLATPSFAGPFGSSVDATASTERTWMTFPNWIQTQSLAFTDGKEIEPRVYGVLSAVVQSVRTGDPALTIDSPNLATGLAPEPISLNGLPVFGTATTGDAAVSRVYGATVSWQPSPSFAFVTSDSRTFYTPGQPLPPTQLAFSVRANVTRTLYVTLGRVYYFNWENQSWSPRFSFQVSAQ
jgi:hypothetical protein